MRARGEAGVGAVSTWGLTEVLAQENQGVRGELNRPERFTPASLGPMGEALVSFDLRSCSSRLWEMRFFSTVYISLVIAARCAWTSGSSVSLSSRRAK